MLELLWQQNLQVMNSKIHYELVTKTKLVQYLIDQQRMFGINKSNRQLWLSIYIKSFFRARIALCSPCLALLGCHGWAWETRRLLKLLKWYVVFHLNFSREKFYSFYHLLKATKMEKVKNQFYHTNLSHCRVETKSSNNLIFFII